MSTFQPQPNVNGNSENSDKIKELAESFNKESQQESGSSTAEIYIAKIATLEQQLAESNDRALRIAAESENVRKRSQKEIEDTRQFAVSKFAGDMINVMENLCRALEVLPEGDLDQNIKSLREGVEITRKEMESAFDRHGLKRHVPLGEKFDHNLHQAMSQLPESGKEIGTILQVLQAGYTLKDRLLRPALVIVAA